MSDEIYKVLRRHGFGNTVHERYAFLPKLVDNELVAKLLEVQAYHSEFEARSSLVRFMLEKVPEIRDRLNHIPVDGQYPDSRDNVAQQLALAVISQSLADDAQVAYDPGG